MEIIKYFIAFLLFVFTLWIGVFVGDYVFYNLFDGIDYYQGSWKRVYINNIVDALLTTTIMLIYFKRVTLYYKYQLIVFLYLFLPTVSMLHIGIFSVNEASYFFRLYEIFLLSSFFIFATVDYFSFFIKNDFSPLSLIKFFHTKIEMLKAEYRKSLYPDKLNFLEYLLIAILYPIVLAWFSIVLYCYYFIGMMVLYIILMLLLLWFLWISLKRALSKKTSWKFSLVLVILFFTILRIF